MQASKLGAERIVSLSHRHKILQELHKYELNSSTCDILPTECLNQLLLGIKNLPRSRSEKGNYAWINETRSAAAINSNKDEKIIERPVTSCDKISTSALSKELDILFTTLQRLRKRLGENL
jgi:hypothetical protein